MSAAAAAAAASSNTAYDSCESPLRGSPAGSLSKKHHSIRGGGGGEPLQPASLNEGLCYHQPDRKVSRIQMGAEIEH